MTENAFYPLFLWCVVLMARAVRCPTAGRQIAVLVGLAVVTATRVQGLALVAAYVGAIAIYAWTGRRDERTSYLRRFGVSGVVASVIGLAPMVVSIARGDGLSGWLGGRSGTFADLELVELPKWFAYMIGDLVLYVAFMPIAATAIVVGCGLGRKAGEPFRLFAATALPTTAAMLVVVSFVSASVDVDQTENLNERYVFYVVPLTFVGMALWANAGLPRPRPWSWIVVLVCCLAVVLVPIDRLEYNAGFQSVALLPWLRIPASGFVLAACATTFVAVCGALWLRWRPAMVGRIWITTATWLAALGVVVVAQNVTPAAYFAGSFAGRPATWVDRAVPPDAEVAVVLDQRDVLGVPDYPVFSLLVAEFFNEAVRDVYRVGGSTYYENVLPTIPVAARQDGVLVNAARQPIQARYVLVACSSPIAGRVMATSAHNVLQLIEAAGPLRLTPDGRCRALPLR